MRKTIVPGALVAAALASSMACVFPLMFSEDPWWGRPAGVFHRIVPFQPGGSVLFENEAGDVEIRGWERAEVEIVAEPGWGRLSGPGFGSWGGGRSSAPDVEVDKMENLLKIKTRTSGRSDIVRPVLYALDVPRSIRIQDLSLKSGDLAISDLFGGIKADVEDGNVRIVNFSGSIDLLAGRGRVDVELLDERAEDEVSLTLKNGDLTVYLQPETSVRIEATASNGRITSEFDLGQPLPARKAAAVLGKPGGAVLSLTVFRGDIYLKKTR